MAKITAGEDKLLMRGFDYATDLNVFDPYYDDTDVLRQLEIDPNLKAVEISKLTKLPTHRVIAAMMRLKADGKLPIKPPAGIVVNFPGQDSKEIEPPKLKDFACLTGFVVAYREWENENPDQVDPDQLVPGTKIKLSDGRIAEIIDPINPPGCFINAVKNGEQIQVADGDYVVLGESSLSDEPETNLLLTEPPRLIEPDGQLSIFFNDSEEPPDPDDYPNNYEEVYEQWAEKFPELNAAINRKKSQQIKNQHCEIGDYIQLKSDPRRIGEITGLKPGGFYKIRFADGFTTELKSEQFEDRPFSKENSGIVLGESFFKVGEQVKTSSPGFEGKIFTVSGIHPTGMIGVIHNGNNLSFPANWLNHHIEKIESKAKSIPLEQTEQTTRKRPAKGCGSGYLMVRSANVKRNEAKGKAPDVYYVYYYSYSNQYGKEIKSSISVPRAKIAQVKSMVENKEHYVKIAKFLGKNLPLSY
jgi:hypothetical protein